MMSLSKIYEAYEEVHFNPEKFLNSEFGKQIGWRSSIIRKGEGTKIDLIGIPGKDNNWDVWKLPIFSGLITKQLELGSLSNKTDMLIEGGGVSISYCLNNLAETIESTKEEITCIVSRFYPQEIIKELVGERVNLIQAPESKNSSIEEEFSRYVLKYAGQERRKGTNISMPSHIKWTREIARKYADKISGENFEYFSSLNYLIISVGSGGTLATAVRLKEIHPNIKLILAEPKQAPLVSDFLRKDSTVISSDGGLMFTDYHKSPDSRISHEVFGPHYEKLNPFMEKTNDPQKIDQIFTYSSENWQLVSSRMRKCDDPVGPTTAAGIAIGEYMSTLDPLARIATIAYETLRNYSVINK